MGRTSRTLFIGCAVCALAIGALDSVAQARQAEPKVSVAVAAGPLDKALMALAAQTRIRIFFTSQLVAGRQAAAVSGRLTPAQALDQLLAGSGLEARQTRPGVLVLHAIDAGRRPAPQALGYAPPAAGQERRAAPLTAAGDPIPTASTAAPIQNDGATLVEEVVVGSHIRGVREGASPVIVLERADIDRAGYSSVADALSALPQAFGGLASEDASSTGADQSGSNDSEAAGVNLRGLGVDATLVLVNGRRLAGTGSKGDFADVSSIPLAAVERIEVLLDGASALYGSDAVGGVVNIVLRSHFDGAETRGLFASAAGGYQRRQFSQTVGKTWSSGHALLAYEHQDHSALPGAKRAFAGAFAQEMGDTRLTNTINDARLDEALGAEPDNPATAFRTATSGHFNPFIGQGFNSKAILDFIGSGYEHRKNRGQTMSVNFKADGALLDLPGGSVRAAIGGQLRRETLKTGGEAMVSGETPIPITQRDVSRDVRGAFIELNIPLFGAANARPGLRRLELSVAGRHEDYEAIGSTTNPKIGLIWAPAKDVTFKASYGTSFRAPSLPELNDPYRIAPSFLPSAGGRVLSLILIGGNPDLKPETATSWTGGVELTPARWPGLKVNASLFQTRFKDRIGQPALDSLLTVLTASELTPFRAFVTPATNSAERARVVALLADPGALYPTLFSPDAYGAIAEARYVNTGELKVRGLDLTIGYGRDLGADRLDVQANLSWLMDYARKVTPLSNAVGLAGTAGYPADLRARASASWTHGIATATAAANHVGGSVDDTGRRIHSWTTADLQVRLKAPDTTGPLKNLTLSATVANLFDKDPPFYNSPLGIGYDPANADPLGRVISVQLTKAW
jgi:outer membrane receptor protein involved in Fe transport